MGLSIESSLMVIFLLSMAVPGLIKFVMRWELLSFKKIRMMKKVSS